MIKQVTKNLFLATCGILGLLLASCSSGTNDVYKGPDVKAETNPLASLNPSTNFSWSTMDQSTVTIEVEDRFNSKYDYYVSLYTSNPTGDKTVKALYSGVARGNAPLVRTVDVPGSVDVLYVKVTDPQGYDVVYGYAAPEAGAHVTYTCATGVAASGTTKANLTTKAATSYDFDIPTHKTFPTFDWSIPSDAVTLPDADKYQTDATYTVPAGTTVTFTADRHFEPTASGQVRIIVEGTLDLNGHGITMLSGAELYVRSGGHVIGSSVTIQENSVFHVAEGAEVELSGVKSEGTNALFYNAGDAYISSYLDFNQTGASIYVAPTGQLLGATKGTDDYTMDVRYIVGQLYVDADEKSSGQFLANSIKNYDGAAQIVVAANAKLVATENIKFQCPIYNAGLLQTPTILGGYVPTSIIYNSCTLVVSEQIKEIAALYMKHATLCGGVNIAEDGTLSYEYLPNFHGTWNDLIVLLDGSFVYLNHLSVKAGNVIGANTQENTQTSLLRCANKIDVKKKNGPLYLRGNLVVETKMVKGAAYLTGGASSALLYTTALDLETCTGVVDTRDDDPDGEIVQPDPYVGSVQAVYTVNFEDQWPVVGDYDVNDIVLHVENIETLQTSSKVVKAIFKLNLMAVGAGNTLGAALQLDQVTNSDIASVTYSQKGKPGMMSSDKGAFDLNAANVESGNDSDAAILPIFYDAHKVFLNQAIITGSQRVPLNTGGTRSNGHEMTITVHFADGANVSPEDLMVSALNFFIFRVEDEVAVNGDRVEVHLKGYKPSRKASKHYFGTGNDASAGSNYYVSSNGFPWGIIVNDTEEATTGDTTSYTTWLWPTESMLITKKYGRFAQWVNSNGQQDKDWMND